jgi:hypothetical protein
MALYARSLLLRVIRPSAFADRRKLTPAIHAEYLAPFRDRPTTSPAGAPRSLTLVSSSCRWATGRTRKLPTR